MQNGQKTTENSRLCQDNKKMQICLEKGFYKEMGDCYESFGNQKI